VTTTLRIIFSLALLAILAATSWAGSQVPIWAVPREVVTHPWFIATLVDTYLAFFTIWLWVAYKESTNTSRVVWLLLIFLLGNIAIALYMLRALWKLPSGSPMRALLLRDDPV
jgi:hypothetical protein